MDRNKILEIVIANVNSLVETLPDDNKFTVNEDTVLFGENSNVDSLSLVSIIVDMETAFSVDYGYDISLTDDRAMTRKISPFENVRNMVDYINELTSEIEHGRNI